MRQEVPGFLRDPLSPHLHPSSRVPSSSTCPELHCSLTPRASPDRGILCDPSLCLFLFCVSTWQIFTSSPPTSASVSLCLNPLQKPEPQGPLWWPLSWCPSLSVSLSPSISPLGAPRTHPGLWCWPRRCGGLGQGGGQRPWARSPTDGGAGGSGVLTYVGRSVAGHGLPGASAAN